jgi:predicted phosphodiesterase
MSPLLRVAALYDIHGNLPALEAVLDEIARDPVDLVVVGGDVMPGPMPRESLERLQSLKVATRFIRGNGDRECLGETAGRSSPMPEAMRQLLRLGPGVELRRTDYDLAAAAAAVRRTAYPGAEEFARVNVLQPPDMLEAFTKYGLALIGGGAGGA